jgi:H2-forming N5,N10-methylenetetrahydromethanopterin dehydrogenase-like enzyme
MAAIAGNTQIPADQQAIFAEQRKLNAENLASSMESMKIQQEQSKQQEALSMLSNTLKNAHDAKMSIINNAKG